ncbi:MAG: hypothetical protein AB7Q30_18615 [Vicinamibacteria bacterium]
MARFSPSYAAGLIAVVATLAAGAPHAAVDDSLADLAARYRDGERAASLHAIEAWKAERIKQETRLFLRTRLPSGQPGDPALVLAASLMFAQSGLTLAGSSLERAWTQLDASAELLRAAARRRDCEACDACSRGLFLLGGLAFHNTLELSRGQDLLADGVERFPADPELWTALGAIQETAASLRTFGGATGPITPAARPKSLRIEGDAGPFRLRLPEASLSRAEDHLARALQLAPDLVEARLRLARVRILRGHAADALPHLAFVGERAPLASRRYLALLFRARAHEQLGDLAAAADAYRTALGVAPAASAARVGLGRSLTLLGEPSLAQETFAEAMALSDATPDPWWSYGRGQPETLATRLATLVESCPR